MDLNIWYLDDGSLIGPRAVLAQILQELRSQGPRAGLFLNLDKCEVFWPSGDSRFPHFPREIIRLTEGVSLLGSPLWGSRSFFNSHVSLIIDKTAITQDLLTDLDDPQVELHLLRSCLGSCKLNHILRTVPSDLISCHLTRFDDNLRSTFGDVAHCAISDQAWSQATLPFRLGGLGIPQASTSAAAAFYASCQDSKPIATQLLSRPPDSTLLFQGEEASLSLLQSSLGNLPENAPSQSSRSLQGLLDDLQFEGLLAQANIDQR